MPDQTAFKVVADSIHSGNRVTTGVLTLHPEAVEHLLTHRALSRNGASKRAIPLWKQIEACESDPCYPLSWGTEQKGMQSGPPLEGEKLLNAQFIWEQSRNRAVSAARLLGEIGLHKETASRVLAPYVWRTYLITANNWDGFFKQRLDGNAQAAIRRAAECIRDARDASTPVHLGQGDWHLPYVQPDELVLPRSFLRCLSAARCARVSYLTHEGVRDQAADMQLYDRLVDGGHWSPLEHVCTPDVDGVGLGNLSGWSQLRHRVELDYFRV